MWALLLQCNLAGKTQEVCAALPIEDSLNYDVVKLDVVSASIRCSSQCCTLIVLKLVKTGWMDFLMLAIRSTRVLRVQPLEVNQ